MSSRQILTGLIYFILRLGVIIYLLPLVLDLIGASGGSSGIASTSVVILVLIFYAVISIILMIISKENFNVFGFLIVFIVSIYKILDVLVNDGLQDEVAYHFFVLCVSIYFMTKEQRSRKNKRIM